MSTTDGAIDQKLFYDLGRIIILLPITENNYANKTSAVAIFYLSLSAQIKQENRYSSIINNLKYD